MVFHTHKPHVQVIDLHTFLPGHLIDIGELTSRMQLSMSVLNRINHRMNYR